MKAKWSVLVVYEDKDARQLAVQFCDSLVQRFWAEFGFELSWHDWRELEDAAMAEAAGKKACEADLLIVAPSGRNIMQRHVKDWLELTLKQRGDREGVLVGLPGVDETSAISAATQVYLRKLAHESGMDYLTAVPESLMANVPESADAYTQRATQVTSVLDSILRYSPAPPPAP